MTSALKLRAGVSAGQPDSQQQLLAVHRSGYACEYSRDSASQCRGTQQAGVSFPKMVPSPGPGVSDLETAGSNSMGSILESVSSFASITTTSGSAFRSAT